MRIRWTPVLAALAFVVPASAPFLDLPAGSAAPRAPRPGAGSSLEGDLEDATASEQVAIRQYDAAHAARADLDAAVRGLDAQVGAAQTRIDAADAELSRSGITLKADSVEDQIFLVDFVVWQYQNRDQSGAMPDWLRLRRRERWLQQTQSTEEGST